MASLHNITTDKSVFCRTEEAAEAFETPKQKVSRPPILAFPNTEKPFMIFVDASGVALGAVQVHKQDSEKFHPMKFCSRTMSLKERRNSTFEQEALAVVFALKMFRHYLLGKPFIACSDH